MRSVQGKIALPMSETKLTKVKKLQAVSFIFCFNDFFFPSERLFSESHCQESVMVFFHNGRRGRWDNWFWNDFSLFHGKVVFISNHVNLISFELSLLGGDKKEVLLCLILKCCDW